MSPIAERALVRLQHDTSTLRWFGALAKYGLQGKPGKRASSKAMDEQIEILEAGAEIVVTWPGSYESLLDGLRIDSGRRQASLASDALPGLSKHIRRIKHPEWQQRVADATHAYVLASQSSDRALLSRHVSSPANVQSVSKRLRISTARINSMLTSDAGAVRITAAGRRRLLIAPSREHLLGQQIGATMSLTEAAKAMRLSIDRVRELVAAQMIPASGSGVSKTDVHRLLNRLTEVATCLVGEKSDARQITHVLRVLVPRNLTARFVEAIFGGEISLTAECPTDMSQGWGVRTISWTTWR